MPPRQSPKFLAAQKRQQAELAAKQQRQQAKMAPPPTAPPPEALAESDRLRAESKMAGDGAVAVSGVGPLGGIQESAGIGQFLERASSLPSPSKKKAVGVRPGQQLPPNYYPSDSEQSGWEDSDSEAAFTPVTKGVPAPRTSASSSAASKTSSHSYSNSNSNSTSSPVRASPRSSPRRAPPAHPHPSTSPRRTGYGGPESGSGSGSDSASSDRGGGNGSATGTGSGGGGGGGGSGSSSSSSSTHAPSSAATDSAGSASGKAKMRRGADASVEKENHRQMVSELRNVMDEVLIFFDTAVASSYPSAATHACRPSFSFPNATTFARTHTRRLLCSTHRAPTTSDGPTLLLTRRPPCLSFPSPPRYLTR